MNDINISHKDKLLFPDNNITKQAVCDYYQKIANRLLPFIKDRPITLKSYPQSIIDNGFFIKHAPKHFPDFIKRLSIPLHEKKGVIEMVSIENQKSLYYLAGQNVIELHMALSKQQSIEKPDQIIFDFDPSDNDFSKVRKAALTLKEILDDLKAPSFIKTSGSRGVHVHIPLVCEFEFSTVKQKAKKIALLLQSKLPEVTTLEQRKDKRGDKVFIDYLRNDYAMTAIAAYSLRAKKNAPIATPIDWEELKDNRLHPQSYHLKNIFYRLGQKSCPWKNFKKQAMSLKTLSID